MTLTHDSNSLPLVVVNCGDPPAASANGDLEFTDTTYLSEAMYSCTDNCYRLVPDTPTLVCEATAQWEPNQAPVCESEFKNDFVSL